MSNPNRNGTAEVRERLLEAWHGEVIAQATYQLIARRLPEHESNLLQQMAQVEGGHRRRLEERMHQLGIPVPDPVTVKVGPWLRLQARIAPVDRLLAAREAAEEDDVDDIYGPTTGDPTTDKLFGEILEDERGHASAVDELRRRPADRDAGASADPAPLAVPGARERLDRIIGREKWHRRGGGWISDAIYGANDGLAAVFGIVAGVSGATGGSSAVLTAGLAGAIASALSMATGAFLASRSEAEVVAANVERERQEIADHPDEEKEELSLFYQLKGIDQQSADELAEKMARHPPGDAPSALRRGARSHRERHRKPSGVVTGGRRVDRSRRNRAGDPVHGHDRHSSDRRGRDRLVGRSLPRRCGEVARDPQVVVVVRARNDARRSDRRGRHVSRRTGTSNLSGEVVSTAPA
jgi:rubrerythrin